MSEYYAVVRSTDHLAHYGVVGMKWGVRRALASGNERALNRHFNRAARKLKKLQKIGLNPAKSAARAAAYGAAAAATGTVAAGGTGAAVSLLRKKATKAWNNAIGAEVGVHGSYKVGSGFKTETARQLDTQHNRLNQKADSIERWGNTRKKIPAGKEAVYDAKTQTYSTRNTPERETGMTNNQKLRIASGVAALGLGTMAGINAYRAKNASKYREKAVDFKRSMDEAFAGTRYEGQYVKQPRRRKRR